MNKRREKDFTIQKDFSCIQGKVEFIGTHNTAEKV